MALCEVPHQSATSPTPRHETVARTIVAASIAFAQERRDRENRRVLERLAVLNASAWRGSVVTSAPEGVMLVFDQASFAAQASLHIQRQANAAGMNLSIGLDHGDVAQAAEADCHGLAVNIAWLLADVAVGGEILVTDRAADAANLFGPCALRGQGRVRSLVIDAAA